jgi:pyridoxine/pyridoxamine 5'-phosphate oxidase
MQKESLDIAADHLINRLWQELTRAPHDKHHEWRIPLLATQGIEQSGPQARAVVLRHADAALWALRVYTDSRSPKCAELLAQPLAQLTFWSKRLHWQLRVSAFATVDFEGEQVDAAWEKMKQSPAATDYLSEFPPGQAQLSSSSLLNQTDISMKKHHLAILSFKVFSIDWLALNKDGHRRAKLTPPDSMQWLVP